MVLLDNPASNVLRKTVGGRPAPENVLPLQPARIKMAMNVNNKFSFKRYLCSKLTKVSYTFVITGINYYAMRYAMQSIYRFF